MSSFRFPPPLRFVASSCFFVLSAATQYDYSLDYTFMNFLYIQNSSLTIHSQFPKTVLKYCHRRFQRTEAFTVQALDDIIKSFSI